MNFANIVKEFGKYVLGAVAVALLYIVGAVDGPMSAAQLALNPTAAIEQAVDVLVKTPEAEIEAAIPNAGPNDAEAVKNSVEIMTAPAQ